MSAKFPKLADPMDAPAADVLAFMGFHKPLRALVDSQPARLAAVVN